MQHRDIWEVYEDAIRRLLRVMDCQTRYQSINEQRRSVWRLVIIP